MVLAAFPDDWSRALCVVAHPDDLEYGAASAIARWTASGKQVSYLLVTRGEAGIEFLEGHTDGVIEYGVPLRRDLAAAIRRHRPDLVVSMNHRETWGGLSFNMADHRHVGLATIDASRDAGNRWIFRDVGEPWNGVRRVELGIASLREHAAYIAGLGHDFDPDAFLRGFARAAGEQVGCGYAATFEAYEL